MNKNYILIAAILTFFSAASNARTLHVRGIHSGLYIADTIILDGNVVVPDGTTLEFLPGTSIIASGHFGFLIYGNITAKGSAERPIRFTIADTSNFSNPASERGGWDGFDFTSTPESADSSLFRHCIFEYGKTWGDSLQQYGGIFCIRNFSKIRISNSEFHSNTAIYWGGAIFAENSNLQIDHCTFTGNTCGTAGPPYGYGGAICLRFAVTSIRDCIFSGNNSTGIGGAVSLEYADVQVEAGIFYNNRSALGGALGYLRSDPVRPVVNNLFYGNSSLFFGGAISCNRAHPRFVNNTITGNSSDSYGGGFYCNDSAAPVLINTILYNNSAPSGTQVYIWDVNSAPEFYYCDVEGGPAMFGGTGGTGFNSPFENSIDSIPGFSGTEPFGYELAAGSPCINAGSPDTLGLLLPQSDLRGNPRISGNCTDIGAYEYPGSSSGISAMDVKNKIRSYPNPFHTAITFLFREPGKQIEDLSITDAEGQTVFKTAVGAESFTWRTDAVTRSGLKPGVYVANFRFSDHTSTSTTIIFY